MGASISAAVEVSGTLPARSLLNTKITRLPGMVIACFRGCAWACLGYNDQTLRLDGGAGVFDQSLKILVGFEDSPSFTRR